MQPIPRVSQPLAILNRGVVITIVLAGLIVAVVFWLAANGKRQDAYALHSVQVRDQLTRLLSLVQSGEAGQRGFLLTERALYLGPYQMAAEQLPSMLDRLAALVTDDPEQTRGIAQLRSLTAAKLEELKHTLDLLQNGNRDAALAIVNNDEGFRLMAEIRQVITTMQEEEDRLLAARRVAAARSEVLLQAGVATAFLLICILAFLVTRYSRQSVGAIASAHDQLLATNERLVEQISARERAENQLRQSQKMQALGQLTGGIAHDFNNMLGVIMGAHDLIARRIKKGDYNIQRFLEAATNATERSAVLTQRLLAFARQQPLAPQPINANKMIVGMGDLLQSTLGEQVRIETVSAAGLWTTNADAQQLESTILNIAINARDAMPEGGKLTIETANSFLDETYCQHNPEAEVGQFVLIAMTDTGAGMTPEIAARVFDPFFTTKPTGKGTGLGLSQVYGFVKQSHGHIKIYTEPGRGTTVKIYMPRLSGEPVETTRVNSPSFRTGNRNEIILVVEDNALMRRLTCEALSELGYTVFDSETAAGAIALLEREPNVQLLFTDVVMPDTNGKKLADEAIRRWPKLKVLFTTGYTATRWCTAVCSMPE